jgi:hypothetical protein
MTREKKARETSTYLAAERELDPDFACGRADECAERLLLHLRVSQWIKMLTNIKNHNNENAVQSDLNDTSIQEYKHK